MREIKSHLHPNCDVSFCIGKSVCRNLQSKVLTRDRHLSSCFFIIVNSMSCSLQIMCTDFNSQKNPWIFSDFSDFSNFFFLLFYEDFIDKKDLNT